MPSWYCLFCLLLRQQNEPEALCAWQEYVQSVTTRMQKHLRPETHFLQIDENQNWVRRIRPVETGFDGNDEQVAVCEGCA